MSDPVTLENIDDFQDWFNDRVHELFLDSKAPRAIQKLREEGDLPDWVNKRVKDAYRKGGNRGESELKKIGIDLGIPVSVLLLSRSAGQDTFKHMQKNIGHDMHQMFTTVTTQVKRNASNAVQAGQDKDGIIDSINDRIEKKGETPSRTLAHTQVVKAHNEGLAVAYKHTGVTDVQAIDEAIWVTAGDSRVCPLCRELADRGPMDIDHVRSLLPRHPNCRCTFTPVPPGSTTGVGRQ